MSLKAYTVAQNATENPRSTEYRLFAQVTRALMEMDPALDASGHAALHWNRSLWIALQKDLADEANGLPDTLKAGLISLAIWVDKHTSKVIKGEATVGPLVEVNRSVMTGLAQQR